MIGLSPIRQCCDFRRFAAHAIATNYLFILTAMLFLILTNAVSHNKGTEEDCCDYDYHKITLRFSMWVLYSLSNFDVRLSLTDFFAWITVV
jgi:hypothetical protein